MHLNLQPLIGTDCDLVIAQKLRNQALAETVVALRQQLAFLDQRWGATEAELGEAKRAAQARRDELAAREHAAERDLAAAIVRRDVLDASDRRLWVRFVRLCKRLVGNRAPDRIALDLKGAESKIVKIKKRLQQLGTDLAECHADLRRLNAPFADIDFARGRLSQDLSDALAELDQIAFTVRDTLVRALVQRPIWSLSAAANAIPELKLADLLQLRSQLRQSSITPRRTAPPPMPRSQPTVASGVRDGFQNETCYGSGSVSVSGSGSTSVRKTRWVTDSEGRRRSESYSVTVTVHFRGSVRASYNVTNRRWQSRPLGDAFAATLNANLNVVPDTDETDSHNQVDHLLAVCGLEEFSASSA